jgi:transposase-like protein
MVLIPRGERRRRWATEQKQTIAAQSLVPGASPTNVARLHGISTGQLHKSIACHYCKAFEQQLTQQAFP